MRRDRTDSSSIGISNPLIARVSDVRKAGRRESILRVDKRLGGIGGFSVPPQPQDRSTVVCEVPSAGLTCSPTRMHSESASPKYLEEGVARLAEFLKRDQKRDKRRRFGQLKWWS